MSSFVIIRSIQQWKPGDPPNTRLIEHYVVDQPGMHDIMQEMRALTESYNQRVLIGELYLPLERLMPYYGEQLDEIHLPFNFQFVNHANLGSTAPFVRLSRITKRLCPRERGPIG